MQNAAFSLIAAAGMLIAAPSSAAEPSDTALRRAARDFRIKVYQTYRQSRHDYDRWRDAGDELLTTWKFSDRTSQQQQQAIDWFSQAGQAIQFGVIPQQPEFPKAVRRPAPSFFGADRQPAADSATGDVEVPVLNRRRVDQFGTGPEHARRGTEPQARHLRHQTARCRHRAGHLARPVAGLPGVGSEAAPVGRGAEERQPAQPPADAVQQP